MGQGTFLYEGLLTGGISYSTRGLDNVAWGESEGLFYRLDGAGHIGANVFVSVGDWYVKQTSFDNITI